METTPVYQRLTRHGLAVALLLVGVSPLLAQTDLDIIKKPKTVPEFWRAVQFEIAVGKFDLAAEFLKGLLAASPTEKDLLAIEEKEGIAVFLNLRNIQKWSDNPKLQAEAKQNVEKLVSQAIDAAKKLRSDPDRIQRFIRNLSASDDEREYAITELKKSGTAIMPHMVAAIVTGDLDEKLHLLRVLPLLDADTVPAVLATFDINNPGLRLDLMGVLQKRSDLLKLLGRSETDPRPTLWFLAARNDLVGQKARDFLQALVGFKPERMPVPSAELLKAADVMYQHKATFSKDTDAPPVWRWDGKKLTSARMTASQAEEHYGLRYARWALEIDANNEAAQSAFLSIATEKAFERVGIDKRLSAAAPAVHEMLALAPASVLYSTLDRALAENHMAVALGVTQVLAERAEVKGVRSAVASDGFRNVDKARGLPEPLVRALHSQDRRVALTAAEALIRTPGAPTGQISSRVVEVFRAALAIGKGGEGSASRPKALISDADAVRADLLASTIRQAGFDTVIARTGRDTLKRLNEAADIDVVWIDHELPFPELPHLMAQLRTDYRYGRLPVFITLSEDVSKAQLPELDVRLSQLFKAIPEIKVAEKSVIRVDLTYDALTIQPTNLDEWLAALRREEPMVRATITSTLNIRIIIDKTREQEQELQQRMKDLTLDLLEVKVTQDAPTRYTLSMDGTRAVPEALENRLARLRRDYPNTSVTRELPTHLVLTSGKLLSLSPDVAIRVGKQVQSYRNVQVINRPVTGEAVRDEMLTFAVDPMTRPLSELERANHQKRAIEGLRRLATGQVAGYDVRPAASAILAALQSDDLALAAIEAAGRLPGKEPQQNLADVVVNAARPAPVRLKASEELLRHMQAHGSAPLLDTQIKNLTLAFDKEPNTEVKSAIASVLGALPKDRLLRNLGDDMARDSWRARMQKYVPPLPNPEGK